MSSYNQQQQPHVGVPPPQVPVLFAGTCGPGSPPEHVNPPHGYLRTGCLQQPPEQKISHPAFLEVRLLYAADEETAPVRIRAPIPARNGDDPDVRILLSAAIPDSEHKLPKTALSIAVPLLANMIASNHKLQPVAQTTALFLYIAILLTLIGIVSQEMKQKYGKPLGAAAILMVIAAITVLVVSAFVQA